MISKFASRLDAEIGSRGLTGSGLANDLGVNDMTISRWRRGKGFPDKESLSDLKSYFGWSTSMLRDFLADERVRKSNSMKLEISGAEFVSQRYRDDYIAFLSDIIAMDEETITGDDLPEHEGAPENWAPIFRAAPYSWKLLTIHGEIVGYWQFMCLQEEYYEKISKGEIVDSEIREKMMSFPLVGGRYFLYLCVFAVALPFRNRESYNLLEASIKNFFSEFTRDRIFFEKIFACGFTHEGIRMCDDILGMRSLGRHPRAGKADLAERYELLGSEIPASFLGRDQCSASAYREEFS